MDKNNVLYKYIKANDFTREGISEFIKHNKTTELRLIEELSKYIISISDIYTDSYLILNTVNLISLICLCSVFSDTDLKVISTSIEKTTSFLLEALKDQEDFTIRLACNKLEEITLSKSIPVIDIIAIIKYMIDINEDVEIIKKMININKGCILEKKDNLFDYTFNKAINAIRCDSYLVTYYIALLKIFYFSGLDKDRYLNILNKLENNIYTNEIYSIIFNDKRSLTLEEIITKYEKDDILLTAPLHSVNKPISADNNIITIDDKSCTLRDDAFSIRKDGPHYIIGIYITDIGNYIDYGSLLDIQARNVYENSYFSNGKIEIFPRNTAYKMSLNESHRRGSIILYVIMNDSGDIIDYYIKNESIIVAQNLSYSETNSILTSRRTDEFKKDLELLFEISNALKEKADIKRKNQQLCEKSKLYERHYDTKSHMIVGELAILYNTLIAKDAYEYNIPYIYRVQDRPYLPDMVSRMNIKPDEYSRKIIEEIFLESHYSIAPGYHCGVQEEIYSQSSSPLRRYADIYTQYLLHKYKFKDFGFDDSRIEDIVKYLNEREFETRLFEEEYNKKLSLLKKKRN